MNYIFLIVIGSLLGFGQIHAQTQEDLNRILENTKNGSPMMDHWLYTPEGDSVLFSEFKGKHVVIDLWATWCKPCLMEAPYFKKLSEQYDEEKYEFISISIDKDRKRWEAYCASHPADYDRYWVGSSLGAPPFWFSLKTMERNGKTMMVSSIPQFVVIDKDQIVFENSAPRPSREGQFKALLRELEEEQ